MARPTPISVTVSRRIEASPTEVYELVSDITRMPEWSPETTSTEWIGPIRRPEVGARFKGSNAIGRIRWSTKPEITMADPGRCFEFRVPGRAGATWRYELQPEGTGCRVTESVAQGAPTPAPIRFLQRRGGVHDRAAHLEAGMTTTLDRLANAATTDTTTEGR